MFQTTLMSNTTSLSEEATASSGTTRVLVQDLACFNPMIQSISCLTTHQESKKIKKKRSLPGNPDPDAEVIALSPRTLLATNRFVCEICNKGFQRDQNLQLHRRGHNLPWKLKQRINKEVKKKAYVCPELSCVHHHPSRALGDLTGIKKHFCRKHGEKKFKCDKCSKVYAVYSDWKAHSKTCGTREYRCDCGTLFSRKDSFVTHRAFCDALAEESARLSATTTTKDGSTWGSVGVVAPTEGGLTMPPFCHQRHPSNHQQTLPPAGLFPFSTANQPPFSSWEIAPNNNNIYPQNPNNSPCNMKHDQFLNHLSTSPLHISTQSTSSHLSATALLQKACTIGAVSSSQSQLFGPLCHVADDVATSPPPHQYTWQKSDHFTRDFLGLTRHKYTPVGGGVGGPVEVSMNMHDALKYARGLESTVQPINLEREHSLMLKRHQQQGFGFVEGDIERFF